ncbi:hypothetical protein B484DRAFT_409022 [Ochromonadaceae sp. CCMP2298]|nr:hypothetical protein B484DRAFT_409022 [Ochromonadaceae sp. CCMP2298]
MAVFLVGCKVRRKPNRGTEERGVAPKELKNQLLRKGGDLPDTGTKFVRNFEHVDGNWAGHVYLRGDYSSLWNLSALCLEHCWALDGDEMEMEPIHEPHLSLSKPFVLRSHQIEPFLLELGLRIGTMQR